MNQWLSELQEIGFELFGRESSGEMWGLVTVCVFVLFGLYGKLSAGFKGGGQRSFFTLIPGVLLMAIAMTAVRLFWSPEWVWQLAAALAVLLVLVLPLTAVLEKTSYLSAGLVWLVCLLALAAVLTLERPLMESVRRGIQKGSLVREEKNILEELDKR